MRKAQWVNASFKGLIILGIGLGAALAKAGSTSGTIAVSLTIVDVGQNSSALSTDASDYIGGRYMSVLTDVASGQQVDIYLNGKKVASTTSQDGTVNFQIRSQSVQDGAPVDLALRSQGKDVQVYHAAYRVREDGISPIMRLSGKPYKTNVPVKRADGTESTQTVTVQSVEIYY